MNPLNASRRDAFCDEFLASHSEYLDGLLPPLSAARMSAHAEACAACGRYDRIVRKSLVLARDVSDPPVSGDFDLRLQQRLLQVQQGALPTRASISGLGATVGVAAAIALLAWSPLLLSEPEQIAEAVQPAAEHAAVPMLAGGTTLVVERAWSSPAALQAPAHPAAAVLATFPGPYSPLVVTPPVHRQVRTIATEHVPVD